MKNIKIFFEKNSEESYEELIEKEPKERRNKKFRERREIDQEYSVDRYSQRFIAKR